MSLRLVLAIIATCTVVAQASADPIIDGSLDAAYGSPLVTQTTQTGGDNTWGLVGQAGGSELDAAYATISNGVLYVFFAGNLAYAPSPQPPAFEDFLSVFIDSKPGGQQVMSGSNPFIMPYYMDVNHLAGLMFDSGFTPDYYLACGGNGYPNLPPLQVFWAELPAGGGGAGSYLGASTPGGPGTLSGGTNPFGIQAALNDINTAGVSGGCGAASGAGVQNGIELAIPLAAIGNPTGCLGVAAFVGQTYLSNTISNQVLGPLPPGTCTLGPASGVNFASIAGPQFFTVCTSATAAHAPTWGDLKIRYR